jgi:hypothetical protein
MSRILVIGGYGGFGARLSRRLSAAGHQVLVGGRSRAKAEAFAATLDGAEPLVIDREGDVGAVFVEVRPQLVIDAAGPFQGNGYRVPKACIALGIPYLDLADARDFVRGIGALDGMARTAGVAVISGASSVPALSGAVVRHLAEGLDRVSEVEMALSASSRASAGASVAKAILSYAGQRLRLWRGGRWQERRGCAEMRLERYAVRGAEPLRRLVMLCDVPDLDLMPEALPGRPAVTFRAGSESTLQMIGLWLLSRPVRWGWVGSLTNWSRWLQPLQRLTATWSGDRSAMSITLRGWRGAQPLTRRWSIIAEAGEGAEIPTLAAALLAEDILAGRVAPGARDASELLDLARFEPLFGGLAVRHEVVEVAGQGPLYRTLMGARFDALPPLVRAVHEVHGDVGAAGAGSVVRGRSWAARLIGCVMGFPPSGAYPVHVDFAERGGRELWTRHFGSNRFSSELSAWGDLAAERFGPLRFGFALPSDGRGLRMELKQWSAFGIPMPLFLAPRIAAREWQDGDRFRFDVAVAMPLIGKVVHYQGWLRPIGAAQEETPELSPIRAAA